MDIENKINAVLETAKKVNPVELSPGFSEKVMANLHRAKSPANHYREFLKIAAMFVLVSTNLLSLHLFMKEQPDYQAMSVNTVNSVQTFSISQFVNQYRLD